jgi:hypothetical protein
VRQRTDDRPLYGVLLFSCDVGATRNSNWRRVRGIRVESALSLLDMREGGFS